MIVRRDLEIAAFVPEDYWQIQARFETAAGRALPRHVAAARSTNRLPARRRGRGASPRSRAAPTPASSSRPSASRSSSQAPMLYDLTALQRDANSALRLHRQAHAGRRPGLLRAAQGASPTRGRAPATCRRPRVVAARRSRATSAPPTRTTRRPPPYVSGLDVLPLGRIVNDAKVTDHHAIIPTDDRHAVSALSTRRAPHLRPGRAPLPGRVPSRRPLRADDDRDRGRRASASARAARCSIDAGWRAAYGAVALDADKEKSEDDADGEQDLPMLHEGDAVRCAEAEVLAKQTKPPAHYSDATLLRAMETAGRLVEDDEAAEAMKESGLGTPATRAATIERLIDKEYLERAGPHAARHRPLDRPHLRRSATTRWPRPAMTGRVGEAPRRDRERPREPRRLHARHHVVHGRDRRLVRRQGPLRHARPPARRSAPARTATARSSSGRCRTRARRGSRRPSPAAATRSGSAWAAA